MGVGLVVTANWLERLVLCPNHVNYHVEHHLLASVPSHRLPAFHKLLLEKGFYRGYEDTLARGYWDVLKRVVPELGASIPRWRILHVQGPPPGLSWKRRQPMAATATL